MIGSSSSSTTTITHSDYHLLRHREDFAFLGRSYRPRQAAVQLEISSCRIRISSQTMLLAGRFVSSALADYPARQPGVGQRRRACRRWARWAIGSHAFVEQANRFFGCRRSISGEDTSMVHDMVPQPRSLPSRLQGASQTRTTADVVDDETLDPRHRMEPRTLVRRVGALRTDWRRVSSRWPLGACPTTADVSPLAAR